MRRFVFSYIQIERGYGKILPTMERSGCASVSLDLWVVYGDCHFLLWNLFDFYMCEILLTFGGTTLVKGMF